MSYKNDIILRKQMINAAMRATLSIDPAAAERKFVKKYGEIFKDAFQYAQKFKNTACDAVIADHIDESLSSQYNWLSINDLRHQPALKM